MEVFVEGISEKIESSVFVPLDKIRFDKDDPISPLSWNCCVFVLICFPSMIFGRKKLISVGRRLLKKFGASFF
jgi:hypothetical protein